MRFVLDMETQDPDDFLTLLLLLGHPAVSLAAVTVTPGSRYQIGIVRYALQAMGRNDVEVGAFNIAHPGVCVSAWHHNAYDLPTDLASDEASPGPDVLARHLGPDTTLVTGAPLKNLGAMIRRRADDPPAAGSLGRLFVQGGFAGDDVIPPEHRLPKFEGRTTCPSFNLNGDPKSVHRVLEHRDWFTDLRFVSKNVCHGVAWDEGLARAVGSRIDALGDGHPHGRALSLIARGMRNKVGKALHDPLAAACAMDPAIGTWAEIELYRSGGEWGSRLVDGSGVRIIVSHDRERFHATLLGANPPPAT